MAITSRKITTYADNIADLADRPNEDGVSADQLKAIFDGRGDKEIKDSINGIVDDLVATTDGASGADQIGATALPIGTAETVQGQLEEIYLGTTKSDDVKFIRLNDDKVLESSEDGTTWEATGSSGHLIIDSSGNEMPQRSRLKFANSVVTDDGTVTEVQGTQGIQGETGEQGIQGETGIQGIQGETGNSIIPNVDQISGLMSFTEGPAGVIPATVNVRGPQGPQGVQGNQGIEGPQGELGPRGTQGSKGDTGDRGERGEIGLTGPQGDVGLTGPKGDKGDKGVQGELGPQGIQGIQGAVGSAGAEGPRGTTGSKGDKGDTGVQGDIGARGLTGLTGEQGEKGNNGVKGDQGIQGIQGPQGPQGQKGAKGTDGTSFAILGIYTTLLALQTAHPTGSAGQAYAVGTSINNIIYNWDVNASQWVSLGALQGPEGPQGTQGTQGNQGIEGPAGADGQKGDTGAKGDKGDQGKGYFPQGSWITAKAYKNDAIQVDTVFYLGNSYYCKSSHTSSAGNVPPNATYWGIMAEKGLKGDVGEKGSTGDKGNTGNTGLKGDQGIQGEQGVAGADGLTTSVNGRTQVAGAITIDQDDVGDGASYKQYSLTEKTKLSGIATGANNYTHPTTAGNKHIPTGGTVGQIMKNSASGTAVWGDQLSVVNGLAETVTGKVLDATQGKALADLVSTKATKTTYTTTITTSWVGSSAPYTQEITITGMATDFIPTVSPIYNATLATALLEKEAWGMISKIETGTNKITVTCFEDKPVTAIPIQLVGVK